MRIQRSTKIPYVLCEDPHEEQGDDTVSETLFMKEPLCYSAMLDFMRLEQGVIEFDVLRVNRMRNSTWGTFLLRYAPQTHKVIPSSVDP